MILKTAFRNVLRQKRRTVLTLLTIFGGFTLAAVSIGWSDGSYSYIINMFTKSRLGHIQVHALGYLEKPSLYKTVDDYAAAGKKISSVPGVTAWAPRVYGAGLVSSGDKSTGAQIVGIDPALEDAATSFNKKVIKGKPLAEGASGSVLLGKGLASFLKAGPGSEIVIVSQAADGSIANSLYKVSGIIESGDEATDRTACYLDIRAAQEFFALGPKAHEIVVIVRDIRSVRETAAAVQKALGDPSLSVEPWQEFAKAFYRAMQADQAGMWIMLFIITLIVAVGVLNTVLMSVLERRREYGLLKALGTKPSGIVALILCEVNIIAAASVALGTGAGLLANYLLSFHGIHMPQPFTYGGVEFNVMYTEINARSFYIPALTTMVSATAVALFPAVKAARTDPAKSMRTF